MIGGQVAFVRMAMRYRHTVGPWARRQGKTKSRQYLYQNEATITPGEYYAGLCFPDHTTAAKIADNFRKSWGPMVKAYKINDKDQDRWIDLIPLAPPPGMPPPAWFTPSMAKRWIEAHDGKARNEYIRLYFWGCAFPHFEKVQGFPHHFNRVGYDETQQIHPLAYGIIRPMIRDVRGFEEWTGTPWHTGIGNVQFEKFWNLAGDSSMPGWFRMRVPDGTNPHVPPTDMREARRTMSEQEIQQTIYAQFLTGEGAVFSNLDATFVLKPIRKGHESVQWALDLRAKYSMPSSQAWIHRAGPREGSIYALSIDWARAPTGDYSVLTVFDLTRFEQVALFRFRGENFPSQMEFVLAVQRHYKAEQLHSDENGMGRPMSDFMAQRHALGFRGHKFGRNKGDYVRKGQILLADGAVKLIDCPEQRHEFKSFSAFQGPGLGSENTIKYCAPQGEHDDTVAAFLHLAPILSIVGRQEVTPPEPPPPSMVDEDGMTTLELFGEGLPTPWSERDEDEMDSWQSVILPDSYR